MTLPKYGLTIVNLIGFTLEGRVTPYTSQREGNFSNVFYNELELKKCLSDLRLESHLRDGYLLQDVIALLGVGEKCMHRLMEERILVPNRIVLQKDNRKRYRFDKSTIDQFLKNNITIEVASREYDVSEITIRRWIKMGRLHDVMKRNSKKIWLVRKEIETLSEGLKSCG